MLRNCFPLKSWLLIFFSFVLFSCEKADEVRPDKDYTGFEGSLEVLVTKPISGPGPNMLVHIYITESDYNNRIPYASSKTNNDGIAKFAKVPSGSWYVDCTLPLDSVLYDSTIVGIVTDSLSKANLFLE